MLDLFQLPMEAWSTIYIDGKQCRGCYHQRQLVVNRERGDVDYRRICWFTFPRCDCCRKFCGSTIKYGMRDFVLDEQGTSSNEDCELWYVTEQDRDCLC